MSPSILNYVAVIVFKNYDKLILVLVKERVTAIERPCCSDCVVCRLLCCVRTSNLRSML